MVQLLYGQERYLLDLEIKKHIKAFKGEATFIERRDVFDSETLNSLYVVSFFSPIKLVIIKGRFKSIMTEDLLKYLKKPNADTTVLLVSTDAVDKRKKAFKELMKVNQVKEFSKVSKDKALQFIIKNCTHEINHELGLYILERCGYLASNDIDLFTPKSILVKLNNYPDKLTQQVIDALVEPHLETDTFKLIDALMSGNKDISMKYLTGKLETKNGIGTLSLIIRNLRIIGKIQLGFNSKDIGIPPFVFKKLSPYAKNIDQTVLCQFISKCNEQIIDVKMGKRKESIALGLFCIEFLSALS